ncbi:hypothetical protein ISN45_At01g048540 [Arabidopsis thaliana x Arabidopsis arenosa]|uniref:Uncharacterized protein n=5 Tax=Arabidopsis TaxID=3701 RepID=A0A178WM03_ARATH|nr:uncharacterized protein AT1G56423 [Arabidopsis thaliana]KAG7649844.1 hypothetical protein ISN45_At01g048540 [Arabidopsis thaliana x Arabidopsis arenosa]KAG7657715.1 hypothetical protein ISN44_As01g047580 [Arabidopsis suecica]AEE33393.1 hypothetical protein AT1G56423 [Arabidopsis thaliana]OAP18615.1 hypothetical protein AXX17_AT1G51130 [Arabidopsis thaliana]CAA0299343.1 unnamed protein product [Arabidopsis thaliana]|eukprot:NP_001117508.1 hypothetical protein AT1G56423 [Arabidopsis thaliana]
MDFRSRRVQFLLFAIGLIALSMTAEKCRELVGQEAASKSGQFTFLNCFDMSSGTLACAVKEGVKLYFYNIRSIHVEKARNVAIEKALHEALDNGMLAKEAAKEGQRAGEKAAKLATRQAKRIIGPIVAAGWDFFEALYFGGTLTEGFLRGTGTMVGAYSGGYVGEQRFGRFGYLVGSTLGNWVGARVGLMVYDVVNGVNFFYETYQSGEIYEDQSTNESPEDRSTYESREDPSTYESPEDRSTYEIREDQSTYESPEEDQSTYETSNYEL